jgi:hypothetical protein
MTRTMATAHRPALRVLEVVAWIDGNGPIQVPDFVHGRRLAAQAGHPLSFHSPVRASRISTDASAGGSGQADNHLGAWRSADGLAERRRHRARCLVDVARALPRSRRGHRFVLKCR